MNQLPFVEPGARLAEPRISPSQRWLLVTTIVVIWVMTHRYGGIWHDGVLYAGQALHRLKPDQFHGDLFFVDVSQDNYSLFGPVYAWCVSLLGLPHASLALMLAAQTSWLLAIAWITHCFCRGSAFWYALLLVAVLPRSYGSDGVFAYAETFVTARVFAEPLALAGLASLVSGKRSIWTVSFLTASAAIHPVIAFPAVVSALVYTTPHRVAVGIAVAGALGLLLLIFGGLPVPISLRAMDSEWYSIALGRSPFVFVDQWKFSELMEPMFWASMLYLAGHLASGRQRKFWWSILAAGLVGFSLAVIAAKWPVALLVQMQTWRAEWLIKITGGIACAVAARSLMANGVVGQFTAATLLACWLGNDDGGGIASALIVLLYSRFGSLQSIEIKLRHWRLPLFCAMGLALSPSLLLAIIDLGRTISTMANSLLTDFPRVSALHADVNPLLPAVFGLIVIHLAFHTRKIASLHLAKYALVFVLAGIAVASWNRTLLVNSNLVRLYPAAPDELRQLIDPGSLVYFDGGPAYLWFELGTASYASHHQAAGVIFSRNNAVEAKRRLEGVSALNPDDGLTWKAPATNSERSFPTAQALLRACEDPQLNYIVLRRPQPLADPGADHSIPVAMKNRASPILFNIYNCLRLRREAFLASNQLVAEGIESPV